MAEERPKISIHSLSDLKNTTDDAIPNYLNSVGYRQIHTLTDVRLALGFTACAIAAAAFYYDFKFGFEAAKTITFYFVVSYFVLNTALTYWIWGVEAGTIYVGENDGVRIKLSTHTEKHSPIYHMTIEMSGKNVSKGKHVVQAKEPFTHWFDEQGYFVSKPLQSFLESSIPDLAAKKAVMAVRAEKLEQIMEKS
ncbi:signal peptidase complex subunit 2 [Tirmania nivea]|nr:signal peptidase complex subunit 2 [Tirmania nivea]